MSEKKGRYSLLLFLLVWDDKWYLLKSLCHIAIDIESLCTVQKEHKVNSETKKKNIYWQSTLSSSKAAYLSSAYSPKLLLHNIIHIKTTYSYSLVLLNTKQVNILYWAAYRLNKATLFKKKILAETHMGVSWYTVNMECSTCWRSCCIYRQYHTSHFAVIVAGRCLHLKNS